MYSVVVLSLKNGLWRSDLYSDLVGRNTYGLKSDINPEVKRFIKSLINFQFTTTSYTSPPSIHPIK